MRYIIYILLVGFLYGQSEEKTISVPKSDVIEWANKLKQYETSDSLQTSLISDLELQVKKLEENSTLDSLIISTRVHQIDLLKETTELYKEKVKVVKPKWHENKWLWFTYGVVATSTSVWLTGQLVGK
ncbi:hypothetical protein HN615_12800 [Candidatus Woesearchaeota archaeon]|jgi:hypothetical protein|nr:hypothetical protein [Candidatus Woesearchaeota archaeon]